MLLFLIIGSGVWWMVGRLIRGCLCLVWKIFLFCVVILVWSVSGFVFVFSKRFRGGEVMLLFKVVVNYIFLILLGFLERFVFVYGSRILVIYGDVRYIWV